MRLNPPLSGTVHRLPVMRVDVRGQDTGGPPRTPLTTLGVKWSQVQILSARRCDVARHRNSPRPALGPGLFRFGAFRSAGGLVITAMRHQYEDSQPLAPVTNSISSLRGS